MHSFFSQSRWPVSLWEERTVSVYPSISYSECEHTILTSLLIVALLADIIHQRWIHDPRFYSFQDVQEEETSCYARILKRAN